MRDVRSESERERERERTRERERASTQTRVQYTELTANLKAVILDIQQYICSFTSVRERHTFLQSSSLILIIC